MADPVWFWQQIVSPHMAGLAEALARSGRPVTYIAEQPMSAERAALGWKAPELGAVTLRFAPDTAAAANLVSEAPETSIHICQGFRGNGVVGSARTALARRCLRQWVIMETVEEQGWAASAIKRLEYSRLMRAWRGKIEGVLAIGESTPAWLAARGMPAERIVPFAYFLPEAEIPMPPQRSMGAPFRFLFVGRLIERKRIDTLIDALARLKDYQFELMVVGSGPLMEIMRRRARACLSDRVIWLGQIPIGEIPAIMADADCLVLPSRHDGWGAVVSESLMVGTPAICSDRCGAAGVVRASGHGGVFKAGDVDALDSVIRHCIEAALQTQAHRDALADWAKCLTAEAGAIYLEKILRGELQGDVAPPWAGGSTLGLINARGTAPK